MDLNFIIYRSLPGFEPRSPGPKAATLPCSKLLKVNLFHSILALLIFLNDRIMTKNYAITKQKTALEIFANIRWSK